MAIFSMALAVVGGICIGTGLIHLFLGLRRQGSDMQHLSFALFALAYGAAVLLGLLMYRSTTMAQFLVVDRWSGVAAGVTYILLLWFVAIYTDEQPLPVLAVLTLLWGILITAHVSRPTLIHGQIVAIEFATLPWGEQIAFLNTAESAWEMAFFVTQLLTIAFLFFACVRQYRRGQRGAALALGAGLALFVLALVVDFLVEGGLIDFVLLSDFAFLPLALVMSLRLSNQVIRTEEELVTYRRRLETMVDERTAQLQQSNEQLAHEVVERRRAEENLQSVANDLSERVKELDCLFGISNLAGQPYITLPEILQGTADLIPGSWRDSELTVARVTLDDREYRSTGFQEMSVSQHHDIVVHDQNAGKVEVFLLEHGSGLSASTFLEEEGRLLGAVAERLGRIVERMRAEDALRQRLAELGVLNQVAQTLSRETNLPLAVGQVCEMIAGLFGAQFAHVILPGSGDDAGPFLVGFERGRGLIESTPVTTSLSDMTFLQPALSRLESVVLSDVASLPVTAPVRDFLTGQQIESCLLTPLVSRSDTIGMLVIASDRADRIFTANEIRLAETLASDVVAAVDSVRVSRHAQEAAISQERNRLARDLHDSVTQTLYSASLIADALPRVFERDPKAIPVNLNTLLQLMRGALAEMRTLLFELRPAALENASLGRLLHQLGDVLTGRTQTPVEVTVEQQAEVAPEVKTAFYRIAQEALNNIAKHARATGAAVSLQSIAGSVRLSITDDGRGFDPDSVPPGRMGLRIMRERAESAGADLVIDSRIGRGTRVAVVWFGEPKDERRRTADG